MKSQAQSWQFLFAGGVSALFLAVIAVSSLRSDVPAESALFASVVDIAAQTGFGLSCLWSIRSSGLAGTLSVFVDHGTPSLRALSAIAPWLVILQIAMGAALRYKLMGAMSHVLGAMLVGAYLLYLATGVLAPAKEGHPTRTAAMALLWIVLLQVLLGIAAYVVRFGAGTNSGLPDTRIFAIGHFLTGALTLGASYVLNHLIRHSAVQPESTVA